MKLLKANTDAKDKKGTFVSTIMQILSLELFLNPVQFHRNVLISSVYIGHIYIS